MQDYLEKAEMWGDRALHHLQSADFYLQIALIIGAILIAWTVTQYIVMRLRVFREEPDQGKLLGVRRNIYRLQTLFLPVSFVICLGVATSISPDIAGRAWLVRAAQGIAMIWLIFSVAKHFIRAPAIIMLLKWVGIPLALLHIGGLLNPFTAWLDGIALEIGNINLTLYAVLRTLVFGFLLFWMGRWSNQTGQKVIRSRETLDSATREVMSKLFEIAIFVLIFLLLLNVMGIDLTALAVFGGALGVGLGFGLQQIASNFISGIIILLDRSISIGDYIQLEDGRAGTLRELTMRSATLETYDGKDIMVPNEKFITTSFTNWTHNNKQQRYPLRFQVAYDTDLDLLFDVVRDVVAGHPKVLSGDHLPIELRPDAEIDNFGESGINILVEFWMEGIDDGENRVGADLQYMIWGALRQHDIRIPFPQREIRVLGDGGKDQAGPAGGAD